MTPDTAEVDGLPPSLAFFRGRRRGVTPPLPLRSPGRRFFGEEVTPTLPWGRARRQAMQNQAILHSKIDPIYIAKSSHFT